MIIVADSALEYWQRFRLKHARYEGTGTFPMNFYVTRNMPIVRPKRSDTRPASDAEIIELHKSVLLDLSIPIHVGVLKPNSRYNSRFKHGHLIKEFPRGRGFI